MKIRWKLFIQSDIHSINISELPGSILWAANTMVDKVFRIPGLLESKICLWTFSLEKGPFAWMFTESFNQQNLSSSWSPLLDKSLYMFHTIPSIGASILCLVSYQDCLIKWMFLLLLLVFILCYSSIQSTHSFIQETFEHLFNARHLVRHWGKPYFLPMKSLRQMHKKLW